MIKRWMVAMIASATLGTTTLAQAETLIGYVQLQRAIFEVNEGKRAASKLKKKLTAKQAELAKQEKNLQTMRDQLEAKAKTQAGNPNPETRQELVNFRNKVMALQETFMKEQQALQQEEQTMISGIAKRMHEIIEQLGKSGKYTLILEVNDNGLLYAKPHLDLTNEVIRKYNSKYK